MNDALDILNHLFLSLAHREPYCSLYYIIPHQLAFVKCF
jgi:hypothetical protein